MSNICKNIIKEINEDEIKCVCDSFTDIKTCLFITWNEIGIKERLTKNAVSISSFNFIKESLSNFIVGNGGEEIVNNINYSVFLFECSHKLLDCIFLLKSNFAYYLFTDSIFSTNVYQNPIASFIFLLRNDQKIDSIDLSNSFFFVK